MNMEAKFFKDINTFYDLAYPFLLRCEVANGILLAILNYLKEDFHRYGSENPILCAIVREDEIKLISIRTPPYNQLLSYTKELDTIKILVEALVKQGAELSGILGFKEGVNIFVNLWCERKNLKSEIIRNERVYKLEIVAEETLGEHAFIKATKKHEKIVLQWTREFMLEALNETNSQMIERSLKRLRIDMNEGRIFLLIDKGKPVSMARKAGNSPNGIAVNNVYTPPNLRRKGYATECVAKLSERLLEEGNKFCFLFTDLSNPTSNSIYQKIGYRPIIDVDEYKFEQI
ncbi:MAG: GNAT family N-acetyltransferase [Candidatus Thorarchaeota archaeon]